MKAGRDLDALVAEKVMGWERSSKFLMHANTWCAEWDKDGRPHWLSAYSTDISLAWQVIRTVSMWDESKRVDFGMELRNALGLVGGSREPSYADIVDDLAKLTPEAICRAALKAVGVKGI